MREKFSFFGECHSFWLRWIRNARKKNAECFFFCNLTEVTRNLSRVSLVFPIFCRVCVVSDLVSHSV